MTGESWPRFAFAEGVERLPEPTLATIRAVLGSIASDEAGPRRVSLYFCGDDEIAELHGRWLDDPTPTDVLSFSLRDEPGGALGEPGASADARSQEADADAADAEMGADAELVIGIDFARQQAAEYGNEWEAECVLYVVHGALHLCGYDDHADEDRARMLAAEARVLERHSVRVAGRHG